MRAMLCVRGGVWRVLCLLVCVVSVLVLVCMCGALCVVGVQCVLVCVGVQCVGVSRRPPLPTPLPAPCVSSKRLRVNRQNARMCWACARFAGTHAAVLNRHTERREGGWGSLLSLVPSLFLSSFFLSSVVLFIRTFLVLFLCSLLLSCLPSQQR